MYFLKGLFCGTVLKPKKLSKKTNFSGTSCIWLIIATYKKRACNITKNHLKENVHCIVLCNNFYTVVIFPYIDGFWKVKENASIFISPFSPSLNLTPFSLGIGYTKYANVYIESRYQAQNEGLPSLHIGTLCTMYIGYIRTLQLYPLPIHA